MSTPLRAVVFERDGQRRLGALEDDVVIDAGPVGDDGFIPTPEGWKAVAAASGQRHVCSTTCGCAHHFAPRRSWRSASTIGIHAAESNNEVPDEPVVFAKFPSSVIGPGDTIIVPREETRPDFEGEMAIVIGRPTYRATAESALASIGAITALNHVLGRCCGTRDAAQAIHVGQELRHLHPDRPVPRRAQRLDLTDLDLTTVVSGEKMQHALTAEMIYSAVELIEYLTRGPSLEPGDVIATGTPGGVGNRQSPPRYLTEGDVVEVSVSHVGTLRNPVTMET